MDADRDLNFAIGWNRFNLGLIGVWPDPLQSPGKRGGLSQLRFLTASFFMLSFMCIPQLVNLFFIWGNVDMMTENLATANIPMANAFIKAVTMWRHRKVLKQLVEYFYQDWHASKTSYERTTMLRNASVVRKISIWCTVLTQTMLTMYIILRISTIVKLQRNNSTRLMIYTAYFPFDITRSPVFELICICQILSAYSGTVIYTGSDSFISMLVLHVCGQFQNLRGRLKNLVDDSGGVKTTEDFRNELAQIVKRHEHLNWFAKRIEDTFNMVFLFQILSCTVQLCFQGFQVFNTLINDGDESPTFQLIFLVSFVTFVLIHLYVYCYVGEMLLVQSTEISLSAYESNWFNVPGKEARSLLFIMRRSTIPLSLTAGNFGVFSLQLFSKIVKTSLGYLSVLLTVTDRKE
ncbi:odorant receptor 13a-like [Odontomachus brunneus]|uniref:odorant receptor 13a-like n=1 Tax=Odontomachus brunneus TaxID=486640 RepID=UPI0013F1E24C|nr:odorant receptor 13a-like [Odontomachus brunneus]